MKMFVVCFALVMSTCTASVFAQQVKATDFDSALFIQESDLFQEMEILRRLVSKELTNLSTRSGAIGIHGDSHHLCAASSDYSSWWNYYSNYKPAHQNGPVSPHSERAAKVLANYLPGFGVVITLEAPPQLANRATKTNEVADEWNKIRQELSGNSNANVTETKTPKSFSLEESLTDLLFKFGPRVAGLEEGEQIAIAASFKSHVAQSQVCSKCHQTSDAETSTFWHRIQQSSKPQGLPGQLDQYVNSLNTQGSMELLGNLQYRQGEIESAEKVFEQVLANGAEEKEKQRAATKLAQIYLQRGKYDEAAKTLSSIKADSKEKNKKPSKAPSRTKNFEQLVVKVSHQDLERVRRKKMSFSEFRDSLDISYSR